MQYKWDPLYMNVNFMSLPRANINIFRMDVALLYISVSYLDTSQSSGWDNISLLQIKYRTIESYI